MSKFYRYLIAIEKYISLFLMLALFMTVMLQVVSRYVFSSPLNWTLEVARYLLIWLVFVGAGYVTSQRLHISVDLFVTKMGVRTVAVIDAFAHIIVVLTSIVMAIAGASYAMDQAALKSPATGVSMAVLYFSGAVGFGLIAFHGAVNTITNFRRPVAAIQKATHATEEGAA